MRTELLAVLAGFALASGADGQLPSGYYRGEAAALPDSLLEVWAAGSVTISITRRAASEFERSLIEYAESLFPSRDSIAAASRRSPFWSGEPEDMAAARTGDRWWWINFGGLWLPYAVTSAAVSEHVDYVRRMSDRLGTASLKYSASIRTVSEPNVHYIVDLELAYNRHCGVRCGIAFTHSRSVYFNETGEVVRVEGDKLTSRFIYS